MDLQAGGVNSGRIAASSVTTEAGEFTRQFDQPTVRRCQHGEWMRAGSGNAPAGGLDGAAGVFGMHRGRWERSRPHRRYLGLCRGTNEMAGGSISLPKNPSSFSPQPADDISVARAKRENGFGRSAETWKRWFWSRAQGASTDARWRTLFGVGACSWISRPTLPCCLPCRLLACQTSRAMTGGT